LKFPQFFRRSSGKYRALDPAEAELLFFADEGVPTPDIVLDFLDKAQPTSEKTRLPDCYVVRERNHLEGWLEAFLRVETHELEKRFKSPEKSFETMVYGSHALAAVDIIFRLKTTCLSGYTQYRISITKLDDDEFLCVE
jgi:hypothetical protein